MPISLPEVMTAIEISGFGEADVLKAVKMPLPHLKDDELLIKVAAAGVNRPDIMQRKGLYPAPEGASKIPGLEISGTVVAKGRHASGYKLEDRVVALVAGGGYAEYCTVPAAHCLPVPKGLNMVQAASLPETYFTVWSNVFDRGGLTKGEIFMVHGGTSGIGTTAIQMAKAFGATVICTSGSDEKVAFCTKLGADLSINYKTQDFVEEVNTFTKGKGVDLLLDIIAGDYMDLNLKVMGFDGRIVLIAVQHGPKVQANILPIMLKRLTLTGSTLRSREAEFKAAIAQKLHDKIWPLIECGKIKPIISKIFPLNKACEAHQYLESGDNIGKIILTISN